MSGGWLRITTVEDRDRLDAARRRAESCGACGRPLASTETVYIERFSTGRSSLRGPVGQECVSHGVLARMRQMEPERCVWCGRRVYDGAEHSNRRQAACSQRCRVRAGQSKRRKGAE
jgi:hypothetical protein